MTKILIKNGKIVRGATGKIQLCPGCGCCNDCESCTEGVVANVATLTVSGVTGTHAALYNATHTVPWGPTIYECEWNLDLGSGHTIQVTLFYDSTPNNTYINVTFRAPTNTNIKIFSKTVSGLQSCDITNLTIPFIFQTNTTTNFAAATVLLTLAACA